MSRTKQEYPPFWRQYHLIKNSAKHRKIDWDLSYDEWIEWWGDDIERMGRDHPEAIQMTRIDQSKGYTLDNIEKLTKHHHSKRFSVRYKKQRIPIVTPHGEFESYNAAARALGMFSAAVRIKCISKSPRLSGWYIKETEE